MRLDFHTVDAFTNRPFRGNPAAIILLDAMLEDHVLQHIANEMNLSETAYLVRNGTGFHLRWFTPAYEVKICGHATLASAHMLWTSGVLDPSEEAMFSTLSGKLTARRKADSIELNFPAIPTAASTPPDGLAEALGIPVASVARNEEYAIVDVGSEAVLRSLEPDFTALRKVETPGVMPTAPADDPSTDFVSRFLAPNWGVDEDPVTGSAHCVLGPYWAQRLGKSSMRAHQASARGGDIGVEVRGDRILLTGQAVTTIRGSIEF